MSTGVVAFRIFGRRLEGATVLLDRFGWTSMGNYRRPAPRDLPDFALNHLMQFRGTSVVRNFLDATAVRRNWAHFCHAKFCVRRAPRQA